MRPERLPRSEAPSVGVWALVLPLFGIGLALRIGPLLEAGRRLFTHFPSEDAYLMLTIARNLALGSGMTTADGTIPTGGTQPLATLLWAAAFGLAEADRELGVRLVLVLEVLISSLVPVALYVFGTHVLRHRAYARSASLLAAAAWYASPVSLGLSMNCQETGLYALGTVLGAQALLVMSETQRAWRVLLTGVLLGVVFWVRNDAAFLIGAGCATYVLVGGGGSRELLGRRILQAVLVGLVSVLIALPWLVYNYQGFGSVVPISGTSQAMGSELGPSLVRLPAVLAQYLLVVVPLRTPMEPRWWLAGSFVVLGALFFYARAWTRAAGTERQALLLVGLFALALGVYYTAFFGAPYFLKRYLFPLSPFLALGTTAGVLRVLRLPRLAAHRGIVLPLGVALAAALAFHVLPPRGGDSRNHWAKVEWIQSNLTAADWVGAIQSGTIGFFHDRTLNLDGKVNPEALRARELGRLPAYLVQSSVGWLVDWPQVLGRLGAQPLVRRHFEVVLDDRPRKLLVLRRRPVGSLDLRSERRTVAAPGARSGVR